MSSIVHRSGSHQPLMIDDSPFRDSPPADRRFLKENPALPDTGSPRFFRDDTAIQTWRSLGTANGGEKIADDDY